MCCALDDAFGRHRDLEVVVWKGGMDRDSCMTRKMLSAWGMRVRKVHHGSARMTGTHAWEVRKTESCSFLHVKYIMPDMHSAIPFPTCFFTLHESPLRRVETYQFPCIQRRTATTPQSASRTSPRLPHDHPSVCTQACDRCVPPEELIFVIYRLS